MFSKYYHHVRIYEIMNAPKSGRFEQFCLFWKRGFKIRDFRKPSLRCFCLSLDPTVRCVVRIFPLICYN